MEENIMYKVLWVDDQTRDENNGLTDFYDGWQKKAENYNIELVPCDNWEDAEVLLRRDFDEYSAVILDAHCKIRSSDIEREEFITSILPSLTNIFVEKQRYLPWYILSAGTMENFEFIVRSAQYHHLTPEEEWGKMLYLKDAINGSEQSPSRLFENIQRVAKDKASNIVLYRHSDTFCYLGKDKLIDARARTLMLRMLSALYYPEDNTKYEYAGNSLRKVLEYLFRSARVKGLLPDEFFSGDNVVVQYASLFMAGYNVNYEVNGIKKEIRWGNPSSNPKIKVGEAIFTPDIAYSVNGIRKYTNKESHTNEDEPWYIDAECKDIFFSYVLQMCYVIKWFGKYVESHPNVEENRRMHRIIPGKQTNKQSNTKSKEKEGREIHAPKHPALEAMIGNKFQIFSNNNTFICGTYCKLKSDIQCREGQVVTLKNAIPNEDEDKNIYPYIAIEVC